MICDSLEKISLYTKSEAVQKAVDFVRSINIHTPDGRHELGGKMYANVKS